MTPAQSTARRIVLGMLSRLGTGRLEVAEPGATHVLGPGGEPPARVVIADPRAWVVLLRGSRGLADAYADALWDSPDPVAVLRVAARNVAVLDTARRRLAVVRRPYLALRSLGATNTPRRSRRDIHAHYDLGNDLFQLMLDETMMYSAAHFATPQTSLRDASIAKLELACDKLDLGPDHHVLEIGTGWGGFAVHAATTRGCRVTTTTISDEQHAHAVERVAHAGLSDRVTVLREDYRHLTGRYDALVSLEMIEAVGWQHFGTFFARCSQLLRPEGAMLLQAITIDDRAYDVEKVSRSFMRTMIFPHGCLPSQEVIARCVSRRTDLRSVHHEDMTAHYATTISHWRANVEAAAGRLEELGYDERFRRLWRIYLSYVEAGFTERRIGVGQTLLAKPRWRGRVPRTAPASPRDLEAARPAPVAERAAA